MLFTAAYRIVQAICLIQIAASVARLSLYGLDDLWVFKFCQIAPALHSCMFAHAVNRLLSCARSPVPENHKRKRWNSVSGQYYALLGFTLFSGQVIVLEFLYFYSSSFAARIVTTCAAPLWRGPGFLVFRHFHVSCLIVYLDLVLRFAVLASIFHALLVLRRRAIEVYVGKIQIGI
ncbi:hypothetical protein R3P38DRAFT_3112965 [Favolaschia claudopus]|uniref:Uncharacterized protein n=1 Tax=Favolaschia claudopus TaxID=2862362 RepID=A0AAV9ZHX4_9AGAR